MSGRTETKMSGRRDERMSAQGDDERTRDDERCRREKSAKRCGRKGKMNYAKQCQRWDLVIFSKSGFGSATVYLAVKFVVLIHSYHK